MKNQSISKDYTGLLYSFTFIIGLCFTVLPFSGEIWTDIVGDSKMNQALEINNARYDMSVAPQWVVNVDQFDVKATGLYFNNIMVESELDEQSMAELFYQKEEIVIRVADNNRISIIFGDNEGF